jgi:tetratricopeptide (TPR) repeat protein
MTLEEARRILGLSSGDDLKDRLGEFAAAREKIAELVRSAPNETLALRYQEGLVEFDRALAVLREESEREPEEVVRAREWMAAARGDRAKGETPPAKEKAAAVAAPAASVPAESPEPVAVAKDEMGAAGVAEEFPEEPAEIHRGYGGWIAAALLLLLVGGVMMYFKHLADQNLRANERLAFLERLGARMIEARRWPEAEAAYREIDSIRPGTKMADVGRRSIEAGMEEEQRQFVGYWSGEAIAAFDLGRLDDAIAAARMVLDKYPNQKEMAELLVKAEEARTTQLRESLLAAVGAAIQKRRWDEAEFKAKELAESFPGDAEGAALLAEIRAGRDKEARDRQRAAELFQAAKQRDTGAFDKEAFEWLREAVGLAPENAEIAALYQKIGSYTRTIHVPADIASLAEAVATARDRDRIVVAEGTFDGPLIVDKAVTLEGAGRDKTFVEVDAGTSTPVTFGRNSGGTRVSGITFRHRGFEAGENRFSAMLVRGAEVTLSDCRAADAAGHGLAVIEAGRVIATRCVFENNGWDGVAVRGSGSRIEFTECEATGNIGHGFDLWDGGSGALHQCIARDNSGNGIVIATDADNVVVGGCDLRANREYGMVVAAAGSGRIHGNVCRENLLGGMVVRFAAARLLFEQNRQEKNLGPGLVLEKGLQAGAFAGNIASANAGGRNTVADIDFSGSD